MGDVINLPLLRNPLNWFTVILMVMVGSFAVDSIVRFVDARKTHA